MGVADITSHYEKRPKTKQCGSSTLGISIRKNFSHLIHASQW